jgi:hypothetical protein
MGRNVTLEVICFIISLISPCTSFSVFSFFFPPLAPAPPAAPPAAGADAEPDPDAEAEDDEPAAAASSVWTSNCQRSSVSSVSMDLMASTRRVMEEVRSHSESENYRVRGGGQ